MSNNHRPGRDSLEEVIEAFQRMQVPDRPPDAEVLARLGNYHGDKGRPVSSSASKRGYVRRALLSSAAALILILGGGLLALVLDSAAPIAVADVVKAAKKHTLVRYKQQQTTEAGANAGARPDSTVYADLTAARLRNESRFKDSDGGAVLINIFDPVRNLEINPRHKTASLRRTPKDYKSFCCSLQEFEHRKGVTQVKDRLGDLVTVKYRFEEDNETSTLWVDAQTKLPVRMEQELAHPTPDIARTRLVRTDFEWDPDLPKSFRSLDEFFSTQPPRGYSVSDQTEPAAHKRRPEPLPQDVLEAWQKAGAKVGWMNTDEHAKFHPRKGNEGKSGEVPAFRFDAWPTEEAAKLPQPPRAFGLDLHNTQIPDAELRELSRFKGLQVLALGATKVADVGLKELSALTGLQTLDLADTTVTDAGLKELVALTSLHALYLGGTRVTDAGLRELARMKNLRIVYLNGTRVTDAGLKSLADMKSLQSLCLSGNRVTDGGLKELAGLEGLRVLYLGGTQVTDAGVAELRKALPMCNVMGLIEAPVRGDDKPPTTGEVRRAVEQGLVFLEKGGVAWMKERGCASCHHVPFLLWSHNEAKRRGFPVDDQKLDGWTNWTLLDMLARGDGGGLETLAQVLLGRDRSSAWRQKPPKHLKTVDPYETLWGLLLDKQKPDGSFPSEGQRSFPEDLSTSWALLALGSRDTVKAPKDVTEGLKKNRFGPGLTVQLQKLDERIAKGQGRALGWLKSAKPDDSTQAVLLRMLVAAKFGQLDRAGAMRKELIARQKPDGGWSYQNGGKESDAFATGQALYALCFAGVKVDEPVIVSGRRFLLKSQRPDGSWSVSSHSIHHEKVSDEYLRKTDVVYSYWGTAWATIGLLNTFPAHKEEQEVGRREPAKESTLIAKPDAFQTLDHPDCSHCVVEAKRRKAELRPDDRVLCWMQVGTDGYINDGAIPLRFFLNTYRILDDGWGLFVNDPEAGFARGFAPAGGHFRFHGWRNGVMVMKAPDGTLYSGLTGIAFEGPKKGNRLQPEPTLVSDWGFWQKRYPQAVAFTMYDKYKPVELPAKVNEHSRKSRGPTDGRLPADTMVLGVWDGKRARAYPLDALEKAGVIHETADGVPRLVLWYGPTKTAAAYRQPWGTSGLRGDVGWVFSVDRKAEAAPFVDQRLGVHWDITGRATEGGPRLIWLDSVQVKWFAWAADHPDTSIYGKEAAKPDYKPLNGKNPEPAGFAGSLDIASRRYAILKDVDSERRRVTLWVEGEKEPKEWPVHPGAELWCAGWWGRLDQFTGGDRVWVWFETDGARHPLAVSLLADELSEQDLYAPAKVQAVNASGTVTLEAVRGGKPIGRTVKLEKAKVFRGDVQASPESLKVGETIYVQTTAEGARLILDTAAFGKRREAQQAALRKRWAHEGLPGTLVFSRPERREVELMLDHEAMRWGRSLQVGDKVTLQAAKPIPAVVRQLRPWRERTQVLLGVEGSDPSALTVGQRVPLRSATPPGADDEKVPPGLGKSESKPERVEWLMSGIYCTCGMTDGCAGHFYTLAACNSHGTTPCGMAKRTRAEIAEMIDKGQTERQIFEQLLKERGPKILGPHMSP